MLFRSKEIIFTSGSTESNNLAIKGAAEMYAKAPAGQAGRGHIITATHEHKAVLDPCKRLQREGFDVTFLEPGADGIITAEMVAGAMRPDTILVTLMWANNEIGTIQPIAEIGGAGSIESQLFTVLDQFPLATVASIVVMVLVAIFFVSGADAAARAQEAFPSRPVRWIVALASYFTGA